jgi:hypothetical protein
LNKSRIQRIEKLKRNRVVSKINLSGGAFWMVNQNGEIILNN